MKRITFLGELAKNTGYGQHSSVVVKTLQDAGYYVSIRPFRIQAGTPAELVKLFVHCPQPEEWEIVLSPPHRDVTPGKRTIYWTMWESTRLPPKSVAILNKCECVLVPSEWNRVNFQESGVRVPVRVVPLGVDRTLYPQRNAVDGPVVFSAGGNLSNGAKRKGVADAILAFQMAFPKESDVRLQVKLVGNLETVDERIQIFDRPMQEPELSVWYGRSHCFVSCARAEGWGLMQLQAMSTGRPVIAAAYAGLAEFLDDQVGYPVFHREKPAEEIWTGLGQWTEPNLEHVALLMREVYNDPQGAITRGEKAALRSESFTWEASMLRFMQVVNELCTS